jgi:hypothetical protein
MIQRTRRKLDEARFFYQHLVNERPQAMKAFGHDQRAFRYYFSAFIQAARSVTWTLGNEEPETWKAWEPTWRAKRSTEEQKLLDLTNELRLDEAKRGGANALVEWEEVALHELLALTDVEPWRQHPAYGVHVFAPPGVPPPKAFRQTYYFEDTEGKEEVTALCKRYLDFLDKILNDMSRTKKPRNEKWVFLHGVAPPRGLARPLGTPQRYFTA